MYIAKSDFQNKRLFCSCGTSLLLVETETKASLVRTREGTVRSITEKAHVSASMRTVETHINKASLLHFLRNGLRNANFYADKFFW